MNYTDFCKSIELKSKPNNLHPNLEALWLDAIGDWENAHRIVQNRFDNDAEWIHAYLHREEGDKGNAAYWYAQCGREFSSQPLHEEWKLITEQLLSKLQNK